MNYSVEELQRIQAFMESIEKASKQHGVDISISIHSVSYRPDNGLGDVIVTHRPIVQYILKPENKPFFDTSNGVK